MTDNNLRVGYRHVREYHLWWSVLENTTLIYTWIYEVQRKSRKVQNASDDGRQCVRIHHLPSTSFESIYSPLTVVSERKKTHQFHTIVIVLQI